MGVAKGGEVGCAVVGGAVVDWFALGEEEDVVEEFEGCC